MEDRRIGLISHYNKECYLVGSTFLEKKVHNVIFQLDKEKALGPNGFSIARFQECWGCDEGGAIQGVLGVL